MNKKIIVASLLLLTLALGGCSSQANVRNTAAPKTTSINQQENKKEISQVDKIEIFDFHTIRRCASCLGMERNTKATLDKYFQDELASGKITFQSVNIEESSADTQELVAKYQATGSSLFINVIRSGQDNIEQDANAWRFARQDAQFQSYFKEKLETILQ